MYQFYFILLLVVSYNCRVDAAQCSTIPISLSDLRVCKNNVCTYTQTAQISIPVFSDSSACVQFVSTDGLGISTSLNITLDHANFLFSFDYSYYTDDPATQVAGFCGCPGGTTVSCQSNPVQVQFRDLVYCKDGLHKNSYCPATQIFGTTGTYVVKLGLEANDRFKILKISPIYSLDVGLVAISSQSAWAMEYSGVVQSFTDNPNFNITVLSDTIKNPYNIDFVMFDKTSQTDFWLLDDSEVNALNEFDPSKLGWVKVHINGTVNSNSNLLNSLATTISDCKKNIFSMNANWLSQSNYLSNAVNKLSNKIMPGSYIIDQDWQPRQPLEKSMPQLVTDPYEYIKDGWIIYSEGSITFFGINADNFLLPQPIKSFASSELPTPYFNALVSWNLTDCYIATTTIINGSCAINPNDLKWGLTNNLLNLDNRLPYQLVTWYLISDPTFFGFCGYDISEDHLYCGANSDINIRVIIWPSMRVARLNLGGTNRFQMEYEDIPPTPNSNLITPVNNGVINLLIQFNNFTITFLQTVIRPKINNIDYKDDIIILTALSTTVPGVCMIASNPAGVVVTQQISLAVSPQEFKLNIGVETFFGNVVIVIQCYEFQISSTVFVDYNHTYFELGPGNFTTEDYFVPSKWSSMFKVSNNKWITTIKFIGVVVLALFAGGVVIFILYKISPISLFSKLFKKQTSSNLKPKRSNLASQYDLLIPYSKLK